jgi:hypothetical protein
MIVLTEQQALAVAQEEGMPRVISPNTKEEFVLVCKERFDAMQKWMASFKRRWDDPGDDDLIRKDT